MKNRGRRNTSKLSIQGRHNPDTETQKRHIKTKTKQTKSLQANIPEEH